MAQVRLQKYFTDCGVMSRRAAEEQIRLGRVYVNGKPASVGDSIEPGHDVVEYEGKIIIPMCDEKVYIMLNKPRGYVTTMSDEKGRKNVSMLTSDVCVRVYPVGRLDMDSDGLLLLTNDGEFAKRLTHPKHDIPKIYQVTVRGKVSPDQLKTLGSPMTIDGYRIQRVNQKVRAYLLVPYQKEGEVEHQQKHRLRQPNRRYFIQQNARTRKSTVVDIQRRKQQTDADGVDNPCNRKPNKIGKF